MPRGKPQKKKAKVIGDEDLQGGSAQEVESKEKAAEKILSDGSRGVCGRTRNQRKVGGEESVKVIKQKKGSKKDTRPSSKNLECPVNNELKESAEIECDDLDVVKVDIHVKQPKLKKFREKSEGRMDNSRTFFDKLFVDKEFGKSDAEEEDAAGSVCLDSGFDTEVNIDESSQGKYFKFIGHVEKPEAFDAELNVMHKSETEKSVQGSPASEDNDIQLSVVLSSPASIDSDGNFTGIRRYSRKNKKITGKESGTVDKVITEEILSPVDGKGNELDVFKEKNCDGAKDVITGEKATGKRGAKSKRKRGPLKEETIDDDKTSDSIHSNTSDKITLDKSENIDTIDEMKSTEISDKATKHSSSNVGENLKAVGRSRRGMSAKTVVKDILENMFPSEVGEEDVMVVSESVVVDSLSNRSQGKRTSRRLRNSSGKTSNADSNERAVVETTPQDLGKNLKSRGRSKATITGTIEQSGADEGEQGVPTVQTAVGEENDAPSLEQNDVASTSAGSCDSVYQPRQTRGRAKGTTSIADKRPQDVSPVAVKQNDDTKTEMPVVSSSDQEKRVKRCVRMTRSVERDKAGEGLKAAQKLEEGLPVNNGVDTFEVAEQVDMAIVTNIESDHGMATIKVGGSKTTKIVEMAAVTKGSLSDSRKTAKKIGRPKRNANKKDMGNEKPIHDLEEERSLFDSRETVKEIVRPKRNTNQKDMGNEKPINDLEEESCLFDSKETVKEIGRPKRNAYQKDMQSEEPNQELEVQSSLSNSRETVKEIGRPKRNTHQKDMGNEKPIHDLEEESSLFDFKETVKEIGRPERNANQNDMETEQPIQELEERSSLSDSRDTVKEIGRPKRNASQREMQSEEPNQELEVQRSLSDSREIVKKIGRPKRNANQKNMETDQSIQELEEQSSLSDARETVKRIGRPKRNTNQKDMETEQPIQELEAESSLSDSRETVKEIGRPKRNASQKDMESEKPIQELEAESSLSDSRETVKEIGRPKRNTSQKEMQSEKPIHELEERSSLSAARESVKHIGRPKRNASQKEMQSEKPIQELDERSSLSDARETVNHISRPKRNASQKEMQSEKPIQELEVQSSLSDAIETVKEIGRPKRNANQKDIQTEEPFQELEEQNAMTITSTVHKAEAESVGLPFGGNVKKTSRSKWTHKTISAVAKTNNIASVPDMPELQSGETDTLVEGEVIIVESSASNHGKVLKRSARSKRTVNTHMADTEQNGQHHGQAEIRCDIAKGIVSEDDLRETIQLPGEEAQNDTEAETCLILSNFQTVASQNDGNSNPLEAEGMPGGEKSTTFPEDMSAVIGEDGPVLMEKTTQVDNPCPVTVPTTPPGILQEQFIKAEAMTPLVAVPLLDIKNEPITPISPMWQSDLHSDSVKVEPCTPGIFDTPTGSDIFIINDIATDVEEDRRNHDVSVDEIVADKGDRIGDKGVADKDLLADVMPALHGNRKRGPPLDLGEKGPTAKARREENVNITYWDVCDGTPEKDQESFWNVSAGDNALGVDVNGNTLTRKGDLEVEVDVHADIEGMSTRVVLPSDRVHSFKHVKSCDRIKHVIGSMTIAGDRDAVDEIVQLPVDVERSKKRGGTTRDKSATNQKPAEDVEVSEVRKSKRFKKNENEESEAKESVEVKQKRRFTTGSSRREHMYIGAHVSISGGLHKAVKNAVAVGAQSFGLFLRSQRQWVSKPIADEAAQKFKDACKEHNFPPHLILPHGSYLMNCGSSKPDLLRKSRDLLVEELLRCEQLGLELFNFHPGSTTGECTIEDCISRIAESINLAHKQTSFCKTVIENMSCQGHTIGGKFTELRQIIDLVEDKSRIGVCLDTCHAMAAGYDLSKEKGFKKMMDDFESMIGLEYLLGVHLNDSVGEVGCHKDNHENIGEGTIGVAGFRRVMNDARFERIPMILETPGNIDDTTEIDLLYRMCKNK